MTCQRHVQSAACKGAHVESKTTDAHTAQTQSAKVNAKQTEQECAELQKLDLNQGSKIDRGQFKLFLLAYWAKQTGVTILVRSACRTVRVWHLSYL